MWEECCRGGGLGALGIVGLCVGKESGIVFVGITVLFVLFILLFDILGDGGGKFVMLWKGNVTSELGMIIGSFDEEEDLGMGEGREGVEHVS